MIALANAAGSVPADSRASASHSARHQDGAGAEQGLGVVKVAGGDGRGERGGGADGVLDLAGGQHGNSSSDASGVAAHRLAVELVVGQLCGGVGPAAVRARRGVARGLGLAGARRGGARRGSADAPARCSGPLKVPLRSHPDATWFCVRDATRSAPDATRRSPGDVPPRCDTRVPPRCDDVAWPGRRRSGARRRGCPSPAPDRRAAARPALPARRCPSRLRPRLAGDPRATVRATGRRRGRPRRRTGRRRTASERSRAGTLGASSIAHSTAGLLSHFPVMAAARAVPARCPRPGLHCRWRRSAWARFGASGGGPPGLGAAPEGRRASWPAAHQRGPRPGQHAGPIRRSPRRVCGSHPATHWAIWMS